MCPQSLQNFALGAAVAAASATGFGGSGFGLYLSFCKTGDANVITSFGSAVQSGLASFSAGDIIGMAVDADNGTVDFTKNGSAYGSQVTGLSSNFSGKDLFFGFYSSFGFINHVSYFYISLIVISFRFHPLQLSPPKFSDLMLD